MVLNLSCMIVARGLTRHSLNYTMNTRAKSVSSGKPAASSKAAASGRVAVKRSAPVDPIRRAAKAIRDADALVFTAGAGMGCDSGLPDFRGPEGFWKAYPPLKKLGLQLSGMSNPTWFEDDPAFAWGFFGHRYNLYCKTDPHEGFQILRRWGEEKVNNRCFVFTSNVDGHFQRAGFAEDKVVECHGSINFMQCKDTDKSDEIWPVPPDTSFDVNDELRCAQPLPHGPPGGDVEHLARPNILMFGDWLWQSNRTDQQEGRFSRFVDELVTDGARLAVVEIGAGLAVPTVRYQSEELVQRCKAKGTLIRINPAEPQVPRGHVSLPMRGLEALSAIQAALDTIKSLELR